MKGWLTSCDELNDSNGHMEQEEQLPEGPLDGQIDDSGQGGQSGSLEGRMAGERTRLTPHCQL